MSILRQLTNRIARWWCQLSHHDADIVSWHNGAEHVPARLVCMECGAQSKGLRK